MSASRPLNGRDVPKDRSGFILWLPGRKPAGGGGILTIGVISSAPLWLLLAAAIKLEAGGPISFTGAMRVARTEVPPP